MKTHRVRVQSTVLISALAAGVAASAWGAGEDGAPEGWTGGSASVERPGVPQHLDDAFNRISEIVKRSRANVAPAAADDVQAPGGGETMPTSRHLAELGPEYRANARIALELPQQVTGDRLELAALAEELWNSGRFDEAIHMLRVLETTGVFPSVGISWLRPLAAFGGDAPDVLVSTRNGADKIEVDFDAPSGAYYAVITNENGWSINRSTDGGATWNETYNWVGADPTSVDAVVVDGYVYIGYVADDGVATNSVGRMRRAFSPTGAIDNVYFWQTVIDVTPDTFTQVAVCSNADDFDNRIYWFGRTTANELEYLWDASSDGTTWTDESPPYTNVAGAIDATWDNNFLCAYGRFVSYRGTDGAVYVIRHQSGVGWSVAFTYASPSAGTNTSISAYGETVIVAYENTYAEGGGIRYNISYDCGDTWNFADLAVPGVGEGSYGEPDVTARGGAGTAMVYRQEVGEPDPVYCQKRAGYGAGPWDPRVPVNELLDVVTGTDMAMNWLGGAGTNYGLMWITGQVDRQAAFDRCEAAGGPGVLYFSEDSNGNGLYTLDTTTGAATNIGISGVTSQNVGLAKCDNPAQLFGSKWSQLMRINVDGTGFIDIGGAGTEGLAYDMATNTLYGGINGDFFLVDPATGNNIGALAAPGADYEGLAWDAVRGGVWGLAAGGDLSFYDPGTGSWMLIGNTGVNFDQVGLAYDPGADALYAKGNQDSLLYRIDPNTAGATIVGDTGIASGGGMAFLGGGGPPPCPEDINGDGVVDVLDLLALLAAWGAPGGPADVNGDGIVDVLDLLQLLAAWGPC